MNDNIEALRAENERLRKERDEDRKSYITLAKQAKLEVDALEAKLEEAAKVLEPIAASEGEPEYRCRHCGDYEHNQHRCRAGSHDFDPTGDEVHTFNREPINAAKSFLANLKGAE